MILLLPKASRWRFYNLFGLFLVFHACTTKHEMFWDIFVRMLTSTIFYYLTILLSLIFMYNIARCLVQNNKFLITLITIDTFLFVCNTTQTNID